MDVFFSFKTSLFSPKPYSLALLNEINEEEMKWLFPLLQHIIGL
jgi:hypothetical protein